jgi:hypothetical protein
MSKTSSGFDKVIAIGRTLPDVEVTTTWGAPALKVRGKMFACVAINKSAEPNSMVVLMDAVQRDLLLEEDPATYYLTDHYVSDVTPCVLVRLSRVSPDSLRDLLYGAHRSVSAKARLRNASAGQASARRSSRPDGRGLGGGGPPPRTVSAKKR